MKVVENYVNKIIIMILVILTLAMAWVAFRWALADMWYFNASYQLDAWSKAEQVDNEQSYNEALEGINKALEYNPEHPHYYHIKGKVLHWGLISKFKDNYTYQDIKQIYLTSISLRVAWPDIWSDLARINFIQEGLSVDTQKYLDKALFYGPYKKEVLLEVLDIYLQSWHELNKKQIQFFNNQFEKLNNKPHLLKSILKNADKYGLANIICVQFKFNKKFKNLTPFWESYEYCK